MEFTQLQEPDLILLDIMMPEVDGYTVLNSLKNGLFLSDMSLCFCLQALMVKRIIGDSNNSFFIIKNYLSFQGGKINIHF